MSFIVKVPKNKFTLNILANFYLSPDVKALNALLSPTKELTNTLSSPPKNLKAFLIIVLFSGIYKNTIINVICLNDRFYQHLALVKII